MKRFSMSYVIRKIKLKWDTITGQMQKLLLLSRSVVSYTSIGMTKIWTLITPNTGDNMGWIELSHCCLEYKMPWLIWKLICLYKTKPAVIIENVENKKQTIRKNYEMP